MLLLLFSLAFAQEAYHLRPEDGGYWSYAYETSEEAEAACTAVDMSVCYLNQMIGAAQNGYYLCSNGWYRTTEGYSIGFYVDPENDADVANCGNSGLGGFAATSATAHCCKPTYHNPGYSLETLDEAEAYCSSTLDFPNVCTVRQVKEIALGGESPNQDSVSSVYADGSVGWYNVNYQERWDGLTGWPGARGAHCCSDYAAFKTVPAYAIYPLSESYDDGYWSVTEANQVCVDEGFDGLCTVAQQAQAEMDGNGVCFVGWIYKDEEGTAYTPGYWGNCGVADTWNDGYRPDTPGAHCCTSEQASAVVPFPLYQTQPYAYAYTLETAQDECHSRFGTEYNLCSRGQLFRIATESFTYNGYDHTAMTNLCNLGWTREADGSGEMTWYQVDEVGGCGDANAWNTFVGATVATFHCCQDFPANDIPTPIYESLKWAYYTKEVAETFCREGASLCSRDQLAKVATEDFDYAGQSHTAVTNMCSQGWTSDAGLGWWQVEDTPGCAPLGLNQMNAFSATTGTYHCCLDFPAEPATAIYETRKWFYYTFDEASAMCGSGAALCTKEQVYRAAIESFDYEGKSHVAVTNMCQQGWVASGEMGWWQQDAGCGFENEWNFFTAETATYHCCLPFEGLALPTTAEPSGSPTIASADDTLAPTASTTTSPPSKSPSTTTSPPSKMPTIAETETPVTEAPETSDAPASSEAPETTVVAVSLGNMPSSDTMTLPSGAVVYDWAPSGFEDEVVYYIYDEMVYLGGYSTCILYDETDLTAMNEALTNSWNSDWYFGATEECTARDYDETVSDQLWVTDKMCDNLEARMEDLETESESYMEDWTASVITMIEDNMSNFDTATQAALNDYIASLTR